MNSFLSYKILFFILFCFFLSCKDTDTKKKSEKKNDDKQEAIDTSNWSYRNDSGDVTMLVFDENGKPDYVVGNPEKIFQKTKSGIEYKIVKGSNTVLYPQVGDVVYLDMEYRTEFSDSLLFTTKDIVGDFKIRLTEPKHAGIEEALLYMRQGDSAIFKIDAVDFFLKTQGKVSVPSFIKKGERLIFNVRLKKILSNSQFLSENKDLYSNYLAEENSMIARFLMNKNYPYKKTTSGLHILTIKKGTGKRAVKGNKVTIDYTAAFIDGSVFDSTLERKDPFKFVLGSKSVIDGLDEAVGSMSVGDHCLIVIPFRLAYGDKRYKVVPPFSTLVFEIELLDAK